MQRKFFVRSAQSLTLAFVCAILILIQPSLAQAAITTQQPDFPLSVNALQASNLRDQPTTEGSRIGGVVGGAVLEIVACSDNCDWYQLSTGEWIASFLVSEISTVEAADGRSVANGNANLRAGPSTEYLVAGGVLGGQVLDIIGISEDGSWYKLSSNQWIADFLVDNAPVDLPVAEADEMQPDVEIISEGADTATTMDTAPTTDDAGIYEEEAYADVVICSCEDDYYNCDSFYSQPQAQACYNYCLAEAGDIHQIDPDGNALACEELPEYADDSAVSATTEEAVVDVEVMVDVEDVAIEVVVEDTVVEVIVDVEVVEDTVVEDVAADMEMESTQEEATEEIIEEPAMESAPAVEEPAVESAPAVEEPAMESAPAVEEPVAESVPAPAPEAVVSIPVGFQVQTDTERGYSLALPRGWTPLDLRSQQFQNMLANFGMGDMVGDLTAFLDSESGQAVGLVAVTDLTATFFGGLPTLLNVSVIEIPNATPEWSVELIDALIKANTEALGDVQILDLAPDVINNLPAVRASIIVGLDQMGIESELFAKIVGLITPERIYVLTLGTTPDRTAEREPVFDQIIGSFGPN